MVSSTDFRISLKELDEMNTEKSIKHLKELGGVKGLASGLNTNLDKGISNDEQSNEYEERTKIFGENVYPTKPPTPFFKIFFEALGDSMLVLLQIVAFISIVLPYLVLLSDYIQHRFTHPDEPFVVPNSAYIEWIEGCAILMAVAIVSIVVSVNDYSKERQFRKLSEASKDIFIKVIRGGKPVEIKTSKILVGDVVELDTGDKVPADGVYIDGEKLKTDESAMTGESDTVKKDESKPFLLSGCTVAEGTGKMLVTAVGVHSEWGKTLKHLNDEEMDGDTPLAEKLDALAMLIGKFGIFFAVLTFIILTLGLVVNILVASYYGGGGWQLTHLNQVVKFVIVSITIIVVAVPEGLPLAVAISLAYSVMKMLKDNNLVRHLSACETMGGATNICSDKTGTLTKNQMSVVTAYFGGTYFEGVPNPESVKSAGIDDSVVKTLFEGIAVNSTAKIVMEQNKQKIIGNKTESALLLLSLNQFNIEYEPIREKYSKERKILSFPFSSSRKRMSIIVKLDNGNYRLYTKGASEIILSLSTKIQQKDGRITDFTEKQKTEMLQYIEDMATQGRRTLIMGFRDLGSNWDDKLKEEDFAEKDFVFSGLVGIEDPLRDEVVTAVQECKDAGIFVRMVTGDNILTAKCIAKNAGIYDEKTGIAMEGSKFRKMSDKEIDEILPRLQVLARSSPSDKHKLVSKLIENGEVVAVTGDGTNDAPALKKADVGLSMGIAGTEVAKAASDIIILDDNFKSIVQACLWGRSIYENIRKFLQFQVTVNVVALVMTLVAAISTIFTPPKAHGTLDLPLTAIQLLWVNLIMDTFAALALATEPPDRVLLTRKPYGRFEFLITSLMTVSIGVQAIYQLLVMSFLYYFGVQIGIAVPSETWVRAGDYTYDADQVKNTLVFNTFVFCQVFNQFNCRKIYRGEFNFLKNIHKSLAFLAIFAATVVIQVLFVEIGNIHTYVYQVTQTTGLNWYQWFISLGLGAFSLVVGFIPRLIGLILPDYPQRKADKRTTIDILKEAFYVPDTQKEQLGSSMGSDDEKE